MRVLVLGGTGFIGRHVTIALRQRGHDVLASSRTTSATVALDITDEAACRTVVGRVAPDVVVNVAGAGVTGGSADDNQMLLANCNGPINIARVCLDTRTRLVHVASSTEPRPGHPPESVYSSTKALGTAGVLDIMDAGCIGAVARVHNTYGVDQPRGRFIVDVMRRMQAGGAFTVRFPDRIRDFCLVDDVAGHLADLAVLDLSGTYDIGTGKGTALSDAAELICATFGVGHASVRWEALGANDPAPASVAGDAGVEVLECRTLLAAGLRQMLGEQV